MTAQMVQDARLQFLDMARLYSLDEAVEHSGLSTEALDLCCQLGVVYPVELDRVVHFSAKDILTLKVVYFLLLSRRMNASLKLCSAKLGIELGHIEHASADGKGKYTELVDLILRRIPD